MISSSFFPPPWLAAHVLRRRFAAVLEDQNDPLRAQRRAYLRLRAGLKGTEVARLSGLAAAEDLQAFARTVPARGYDFFADLTSRVVDRGERAVLFHGPPLFIGLSSGTTGVSNKRIVHNRATLRAFQGWEFALGALIERHAGVNPVVSDRLVWGAVPPETTRSPTGVEQGYISGFLAANSRRILRRRTVPSGEVGQIPDMGRKIKEAARQVRGRDVRIASAVPSYLISLLEALRAEWGVANFAGIWPRLDVVLYSGTPIACYREPICGLLGREVQFLGMYLATECPIGYEVPSLSGGRSGLYSFHHGDVVFTFRRLDGDGGVLTVGDLVEGDEVELLLSTPGGLINYRVGDCLKIHAVRPLLFEVTGRIGHGVNIATEKVTLSQLARAVARVSGAAPAPIRHFFVCPGRSGGGRPCYEWTLLAERPGALDPGAMSAALDRALMEENGDYRECREELGFLDAPRVHVMDAAVARRYFERDAHRGQLKMKTAFETREELDRFLRGLGVSR